MPCNVICFVYSLKPPEDSDQCQKSIEYDSRRAKDASAKKVWISKAGNAANGRPGGATEEEARRGDLFH